MLIQNLCNVRPAFLLAALIHKENSFFFINSNCKFIFKILDNYTLNHSSVLDSISNFWKRAAGIFFSRFLVCYPDIVWNILHVPILREIKNEWYWARSFEGQVSTVARGVRWPFAAILGGDGIAISIEQEEIWFEILFPLWVWLIWSLHRASNK